MSDVTRRQGDHMTASRAAFVLDGWCTQVHTTQYAEHNGQIRDFLLTFENDQTTQTENVSYAHDMTSPLLKERVHARRRWWYSGSLVETKEGGD
jgi:hypothetical protein